VELVLIFKFLKSKIFEFSGRRALYWDGGSTFLDAVASRHDNANL